MGSWENNVLAGYYSEPTMTSDPMDTPCYEDEEDWDEFDDN